MNSEESQSTQINTREEGYTKIRSEVTKGWDKNRDQSLENYTNQIIESLKNRPDLTDRDFSAMVDLICTRIAEHKNRTNQITENTAQLLQGLQKEIANKEANAFDKRASAAMAASSLIATPVYAGNCDFYQKVNIVLEEGDRRQVISGTKYGLVGLCFGSEYERFPFTDSYAVAIEPRGRRFETYGQDCETFTFGSQNNTGTLATIRRKNLSLNESALACVGKTGDGEPYEEEIDHKGVSYSIKPHKKRR